MIWDHFFPLREDIRQIVTDFKKANFTKYTVALQMRVPVITPEGGNDHWYAPPMPARELFFQAAEQMSRSSGVPYEDITWFIATQDEEWFNWFKKHRNASVVWYSSKPTVAYDLVNVEGKIAGIITFYLMSESNDILVTDFSSYGHVAAAKGGLTPVSCNHKQFCARRLSATPCQQTPYPIQVHTCLQQLGGPIHFLAPDMTCAFIAANRN